NAAARFPSGANVQTPWAVELNPDGPFSVEAWLRPAANVAAGAFTTPLASGHFDTSRSGWLIYQGQAGWGFRAYNQNALNSAVNITGGGAPVVGQWYHVVAVWDGAHGSIYVNGTLRNTSPNTNFVANPDGPFTIGMRSDGGFPWEGDADEVAFYDSAL